MTRSLVFCCLCLWGFSLSLKAQEKKDTLDTVIISEQKQIDTRGGIQSISGDILNRYRQQGLQDVLMQHSAVFIKNYGVSNMSTISIRGSSAAQTAVLWHGININNALTGISDFSLLPMSLFNQVQVAYGSRPETPGIGGAIILNHQKPFYQRGSKFGLGLGYETIESASGSLTYSVQKSNLYNQTQVVVNRGNNRYPFYNAYTNTDDTLKHSANTAMHIMNHAYFSAGRHEAAWHSWWQYTERDIPAAAFERLSEATEKIQSFRNVFDYQYKAPFQTTYNVKAGFILDEYRYQNPLIHLNTHAQSYQIPLELSIEKRAGAHRFQGKTSMHISGLIMPTKHELFRAGVEGSYRYSRPYKPWDLQAKVIYERGNWFTVNPAVRLFARYTLPKRLKEFALFGAAYTAYRLPTLNELYFQPGGNPDLRPEKSRNVEGGIQWQKANLRTNISTEWAGFYRQVDDWIVWFGSSILTPHNLKQVMSRGLEGHVDLRWYLKKIIPVPYDEIIQVASKNNDSRINIPALRLDAHYAYTLATTSQSDIPNDYSIGKQIPYVPRYQVKVNPGIEFRSWSLYYQFMYTGYRFTTTDESQWLMPYSISGIQLGKSLALKTKQTLQFQVGIRNLFNTQYETLIGRIMPGKTVTLQAHWQIR